MKVLVFQKSKVVETGKSVLLPLARRRKNKRKALRESATGMNGNGYHAAKGKIRQNEVVDVSSLSLFIMHLCTQLKRFLGADSFLLYRREDVSKVVSS